jgi:tRNA 2-selenouridine synthase
VPIYHILSSCSFIAIRFAENLKFYKHSLQIINFGNMIQGIHIHDFFSSGLPLIDVRSPGEFLRGHIPGAFNIPLFSDEERAQIGTLYTQLSAEKAMEKGLEFAEPKRQWYLDEACKAAPGGNVAVHCWRGGLRSRSFARHLGENGFKRIELIKGGYKAYRRQVLAYFENPLNLAIIGGYTGSGKTEILGTLASLGEQTIDLEGIACHKGSSFGAIGCGPQPTTEQFENNLFEAFRNVDSNRPVWLEDESHNIGGVNLPLPLWQQMQKSRTWFLRVPREMRAMRLVSGYAGFGPGVLTEAITRISRRLGLENSTKATRLVEGGLYFEAALIILGYYDKSYDRALSLHSRSNVIEIGVDSADQEINASLLIEYEKGRRTC